MLSTIDLVELEVLRITSAPPAAARLLPSRTISSAPRIANQLVFVGGAGNTHRFPPPARLFSSAGGDWVSRFSRVELLYLRGVFDSAGSRRTCVGARRLFAFRLGDTVGFPHFRFRSLLPSLHMPLVQRFECGLAAALAWLGVRMVRYAFPV
jgi:hypothetical protein